MWRRTSSRPARPATVTRPTAHTLRNGARLRPGSLRKGFTFLATEVKKWLAGPKRRCLLMFGTRTRRLGFQSCQLRFAQSLAGARPTGRVEAFEIIFTGAVLSSGGADTQRWPAATAGGSPGGADGGCSHGGTELHRQPHPDLHFKATLTLVSATMRSAASCASSVTGCLYRTSRQPTRGRGSTAGDETHTTPGGRGYASARVPRHPLGGI